MTGQGICPECQSRQRVFLLFGDWILTDHPPAGGYQQHCEGSGMEPQAVLAVGLPAQETSFPIPNAQMEVKV